MHDQNNTFNYSDAINDIDTIFYHFVLRLIGEYMNLNYF